MVAFYIVIDLPRVRREAIELIPLNLRDEVIHVARQLGRAVGGFLRGQVLVALIVGLLMSVGFAAIGLRFWLIIGMIAGFFNIVPFVGPWVGGFLGVIVGLADDVQTAILAGVVALVVQQIDNNFVSPTVLRATVRLHPAVVLLVLILGGAVGGLWGVFAGGTGDRRREDPGRSSVADAGARPVVGGGVRGDGDRNRTEPGEVTPPSRGPRYRCGRSRRCSARQRERGTRRGPRLVERVTAHPIS